MKILVIGGGGREHALVWKMAHESVEHQLFCAPGNAGTAQLATNIPLAADDLSGLLGWALKEAPDLTVVGPEVPLCMGLVDLFEEVGLRVFGPSKEAARLEGSKMFAKEIMLAAGVPTAKAAFFTDENEALAYAKEVGVPLVVKADGLAAGKGVCVCTTMDEINAAIHSMLGDGVFGQAGNRILIEECLEGEEVSILALVDGDQFVCLASSQDHKRAHEGDTGPNTGGMGAYSPASILTDEHWVFIRENVFKPTITELKKRGIVYKGVLYAGLMMTPDGPQVLEFNCRFGDPETQAVLVRLDSDLVPAFEACIDGCLSEEMLRWKKDPSVCVVMASGGYPGSYEKGQIIHGLREVSTLPGIEVFHAGTCLQDENVTTSGGRVLAVTACAPCLSKAVKEVYCAVSGITFDGAFSRQDIAWRELERAL